MTITRALAELKLLDSRITKEINASCFVDVYQNRKDITLGYGMTKKEFQGKAKSSYDSIVDLIERRNKIKGEILKSNSNTKVVISGKEYYVVEAIDRKNSIKYERNLLSKMEQQISTAKTHIDQQRVKLDGQIETMLTQNLGTDKKADSEDWDNIAKPLLDANEFKMLDPLNIKVKIEKLEKEIDDFLHEVDFVLSESNSKTEIEV
jgi:hypothetical protein